VLADDPRGAEPLLAGAADADWIFERLTLASDKIEAALGSLTTTVPTGTLPE